MGILNVTPDSFSDGGRFNDLERALAHAREMVAQGADIIDIGAESTRPGHSPVSAEEELRRLLPVVRAVARELDVPISVDTYKAQVAEAAIREGAHVVNDVWGLKRDPRMAPLVARLGVPVIVMHNRQAPVERDPIGTLLQDLWESVQLARRAGVREEQIILDPGIGFAKTYEQNLLIMRRLRDVRALGYPVLLGTSRKSMIGRTLNLPVDRRVEGTAATVALGVALGMDIVRVHDVPEMVRTVRMTEAMIGRGA
ncbi:MAG: dihydropteroate synthase [Kyrpidia sp.]|nr:dihydropteroate synthase [Kyrpidia sp.]HHY66266.1 dihydropteroate synthase [Alicyclobacillus sp.]